MSKHQLNITLRRILVSSVVFVQICFPTVTFAEESNPADTPDPAASSTPAESAPANTEAPQETVPAAPTTPAPTTGPTDPVGPQQPTGPTTPVGPQQPTGAASTTYALNPATGLWENDYYTWDSATGQTRPKTQPSYSYNPTTGMWDTTDWYYSPEAGKYLPNTVSSPVNPYAARMQGGYGGSIGNTGPNSNNTINYGGNTNGTFDLFFNASISNKIGQMSRSGNASVQGNTWGGNALTGDALALLNVLNMLQASWGDLGSDELSVFMANLDGDITGDLYIDPSQIGTSGGNKNIDVNVASDAAIHNDIDVEVASGNALVSGNTTGGNATSGNAKAVINLLNLINSAIKSKKSFIGVLNINGNLNGDILLPPDLIKAIIAASGPNSNNQITSNSNKSLTVSGTDKKIINNDINAGATTGNANVSNNTNGGSAESGKANTNIVLLNLTGQKVVAKNALLVFVNVMGSWVGLIFDAPAGSYAVAATGPGSNNTINADDNTDVNVDITKTSLIDNDIDATAHSGDASVTSNTNGGNAKTGDADVGVNVLNMIDSDFDISDWFGVLFINVFGSWQGSFGVDTAAGNVPAGGRGGGDSVGIIPALSNPTGNTFGFVPHAAHSTTIVATANTTGTDGQGGQSSGQTHGAQTATPTLSQHAKVITPAPPHRNSLLWISAITLFMGALLLGGERFIILIRSRQAF